MTSFGVGTPAGMIPRDGINQVVRRLENLEREIREMRPMLVHQGTIQSPNFDGNAAERVVGSAGYAFDGPSGRGVLNDLLLRDTAEMVDHVSGDLMPIGGLAFGTVAETTTATFSCAGNAIWRSDPLESPLTVSVATGRLLVIVSAVLFSSNSASNAVMSWTLTGPTAVAADNQRALVAATAGYPAAGYDSGSYVFLHTGLTAGSYTIKPSYRCDQYGATADTAMFENRSVVAMPF